MTAAHTYASTLLFIDKVSLRLGGRLILRDVEAEIKDVRRPGCTQGQVVALLGPSGIGKTQLLRLIAGLQTPDAGTVWVPSADPRYLVPVRRGQVGVVYQHYPLFEHRTVRGNLRVAARQSAIPVADQAARVAAMLGRFQLDANAEHYPAELSGGQRQRVAIAQQMLCSEHLLLMDEPFSGLDPVMAGEVGRLVNEVATADDLNTVLIVTHDIAAAVTVADHLWLIGRERDPDGRIVTGARIVESYDLIARDLAWHHEIALTPEFSAFVREVRARFATL